MSNQTRPAVTHETPGAKHAGYHVSCQGGMVTIRMVYTTDGHASEWPDDGQSFQPRYWRTMENARKEARAHQDSYSGGLSGEGRSWARQSINSVTKGDLVAGGGEWSRDI